MAEELGRAEMAAREKTPKINNIIEVLAWIFIALVIIAGFMSAVAVVHDKLTGG